ncbi:GWxTD domain-containing protein [Gracilimonas sp.]|uniref:GWxTD domain-containing protein n=1 Tax=Gracilimonas sp. TaxID=1974203 RepID=UPI0028729B59|nr:GWxTD domain-containing protein [Gracilimonas sp.]
MSKYFSVLLLLLLFSTSLFAQRVSYPQLVMQSERPSIFIDDLILPGENGKTTLAFIFRFNNDFMPFKKLPVNNNFSAPDSENFYTTMRLSSEIFEGKLNRGDALAGNSASRDIWTDTLFTPTFEDTKSAEKFASGALVTPLAPGSYHYILQLSMMQEISERNTQKRNIKVPDLSTKETGEIYLLKDRQIEGSDNVFTLMSLESNVPFGKNFKAMVRLPNYTEESDYSVHVTNTKVASEDTSTTNDIFRAELSSGQIFTNASVQLLKNEEPTLQITEGPYTYSVLSIPSAEFDNALYSLSIQKNEETVASRFFRSYWPDMPASLYNLQIAIDHLSYIVPESEIERIKKGNKAERERKFREFWESKDPTPNTVYNELMAEYYRRIDYAFKEFGSQENPMGHESDQGEIYIKFGPPNNKERVFPPEGNTREIWTYPNRTFVFEATTGFGDYVLVGTR